MRGLPSVRKTEKPPRSCSSWRKNDKLADRVELRAQDQPQPQKELATKVPYPITLRRRAALRTSKAPFHFLGMLQHFVRELRKFIRMLLGIVLPTLKSHREHASSSVTQFL
jgi:hypothetical protein